MFEHMAQMLPEYERFYETCKSQFLQTKQDRLTTLMSYLYVDIVHFCLEVRRIFARGLQGMYVLRTVNTHIPAAPPNLHIGSVKLTGNGSVPRSSAPPFGTVEPDTISLSTEMFLLVLKPHQTVTVKRIEARGRHLLTS